MSINQLSNIKSSIEGLNKNISDANNIANGKNGGEQNVDSGNSFRAEFEKIQNAHQLKNLDGIKSSSIPNNVNPLLKSGLVGQNNSATSLGKPSLVFSKHAVDRMKSRGIGLGAEKMSRLETALSKAESKGSKDTLVLMDDSAFIMNVKNKTIVTAMDKAMLKENLFTNIDSTIMV